ncbi:flippase [Methanobacterium oryzae]|uniref:flippase n=1 Tax=Methanobacterium oryzae TaxID=69540 RepID=UPI003D1D347E
MKISWNIKIKHILESKDYKGLLNNFISLSSLQIVSYILPLITLPYLVRVLGPEKYGLIAFATAFITYFQILTDYGFNLSATREISIHRDNKAKICEIFSSVMIVKGILAILSFIILSFIVFLIPQFKTNWSIYFITFGIVIGYLLLPIWFFQGMEKMKYITILNISAQLIFTASIFIFIRNPSDYIYVPLLNSLGFIIAGVLGLRIIFKNFGMKFKLPTYQTIKFQFKEGWHVFISTFAVSLYTNSSVFAVGLFTNNTITGYYAIAEKLMLIIQTFPLSSLLQSLYPRLSKIHLKDPIKALRLSNRFQYISTISYLLFLPIVFFLAPWIVTIIAGKPYEEIIIAFRILLIAVFFINANAFRIYYLLVTGKSDIYAKIHVSLGLFGTILVFLLSYVYSYIGAAVAICLINLYVLIITIYYSKKKK